MTKTKTIEVPETGVKITIEWQEKEDQFSLPLMGRHMSLHDVEREVMAKVVGPIDDVKLTDLCRLQHIKDARHVFCYAARYKYGYSITAISEYLQRGNQTIHHSLKQIKIANKRNNPALWAAFMRWQE